MFMEAKSFWVMLVARFLQGISSSTVWVIGLAMLYVINSTLLCTHQCLLVSDATPCQRRKRDVSDSPLFAKKVLKRALHHHVEQLGLAMIGHTIGYGFTDMQSHNYPWPIADINPKTPHSSANRRCTIRPLRIPCPIHFRDDCRCAWFCRETSIYRAERRRAMAERFPRCCTTRYQSGGKNGIVNEYVFSFVGPCMRILTAGTCVASRSEGKQSSKKESEQAKIAPAPSTDSTAPSSNKKRYTSLEVLKALLTSSRTIASVICIMIYGWAVIWLDMLVPRWRLCV